MRPVRLRPSALYFMRIMYKELKKSFSAMAMYPWRLNERSAAMGEVGACQGGHARSHVQAVAPDEPGREAGREAGREGGDAAPVTAAAKAPPSMSATESLVVESRVLRYSAYSSTSVQTWTRTRKPS